MGAWDTFRRSVRAEKTPPLLAVAQTKGTKHVPPRAVKPHRGWFGRTFVEPVERLLWWLSRFVVMLAWLIVILAGIIVAGIVCIAVFAPAKVVTSPTPVANVLPQLTAERVEEKEEVQTTRPGGTWVKPYTRKDGTHVKGHWRKN